MIVPCIALLEKNSLEVDEKMVAYKIKKPKLLEAESIKAFTYESVKELIKSIEKASQRVVSSMEILESIQSPQERQRVLFIIKESINRLFEAVATDIDSIEKIVMED